MSKLIPENTSFEEIYNSENFHRRLEMILSLKGISKREICLRIGINPVSLSINKSRNYIPDTRLLIKLADALDVTLDYLVCGRLPVQPISEFDMTVIERMKNDPIFCRKVKEFLIS